MIYIKAHCGELKVETYEDFSDEAFAKPGGSPPDDQAGATLIIQLPI
jgi:hypothetical protein